MSAFDFSVDTAINGVTYKAMPDYTSQEVKDMYGTYAKVFLDINNVTGDNATAIEAAINALQYGDPPGSVTAAKQFYDSIQDMIDLATDGVSGAARPYITADMASAIDQLVNSLEAAGIGFDANNQLTQPFNQTNWQNLLLNWKNLIQNTSSMQNVMYNVLAAWQGAASSFQALIEMVYVKGGNEVIGQQLEYMEGALGTTNTVLNLLNTLQNLHNNLTTHALPSTAEYPPGTLDINGDPYPLAYLQMLDSYAGIANTYYSAGILPKLPGGDPFFALDWVNVSVSQGSNFFTENPHVIDQFIQIYHQIGSAISSLAKDESQFSDGVVPAIFDSANVAPGSLLDTLMKTYGGITASYAAVPMTGDSSTLDSSLGSYTASKDQWAFHNWIVDNYTATAGNQDSLIAGQNAGAIQRDLTAAITAGQGLNSSQQETVRRFLFIFEEFYKSASAMLTAVTQIIQKMAQKISQ